MDIMWVRSTTHDHNLWYYYNKWHKIPCRYLYKLFAVYEAWVFAFLLQPPPFFLTYKANKLCALPWNCLILASPHLTADSRALLLLLLLCCQWVRPSPSLDDWFPQHPKFLWIPVPFQEKMYVLCHHGKDFITRLWFLQTCSRSKLQTLMACVVKSTLLTMSHVISRAWKTASQKCRCDGNSAVHRPEILHKSHLSE